MTTSLNADNALLTKESLDLANDHPIDHNGAIVGQAIDKGFVFRFGKTAKGEIAYDTVFITLPKGHLSKELMFFAMELVGKLRPDECHRQADGTLRLWWD